MASEQRRARVEHQMQRAIAQLIARELSDPCLGMATISGVEVSRDYAYAKVYVSLLAAPDEEAALDYLQRHAKHLRHRLGQVLKMRSLPELRFRLDKTVERGQALSRLIDEAVGRSRGDDTKQDQE